jgi:hypothetical protein
VIAKTLRSRGVPSGRGRDGPTHGGGVARSHFIVGWEIDQAAITPRNALGERAKALDGAACEILGKEVQVAPL